VAAAGSIKASRFGVKNPERNDEAWGSGHRRRRKEALTTRRRHRLHVVAQWRRSAARVLDAYEDLADDVLRERDRGGRRRLSHLLP
jgi:hypothetical protein